jgi:hypothetical protein
MSKLRIARVSTVKFSIITQLLAQLKVIKLSGADLTIISSDEDTLGENVNDLAEFNFVGINISRRISPLRDLWTLSQLIKIFKSEQFDIVHSITPKAGLLYAIAGRISGI